MQNKMRRLTTNKDTKDMNMTELAHNCCYIQGHNARYRDFEDDMDARDFARKLMVTYGHWKPGKDRELDDNDIFDETMLELLHYVQYEMPDTKALITLLYQNLWAMAELRETLKVYEDEAKGGLEKMTKCDFCTKSNPNKGCIYGMHPRREKYCRKAVDRMAQVLSPKNQKEDNTRRATE